jgi:hypothetical protein
VQSLPLPIEPIFERPPSPSSPPASSPPPPVTYLSSLRPSLFLPPPYTPSHPIFAHLSSLANQESLERRAVAEKSIVDLIQTKVAEIETADTELRRNVEILWQKFRENVNQIQQDRSYITAPRTTLSRSSQKPATNGLGSPSYGTPIAVRDFTPAVVSPSRYSPPSVPRISALSASLATSSFHHPRARASQTSSPPLDRPRSSASNRSNGSSNSGSSTLVVPPPSEGSNVLKFKRNISDTINTAASFRYFVNLEEDMARHKRGRETEIGGDNEGLHQSQQSGPLRPTGSKGAKDVEKQPSQSPSQGEPSNSAQREGDRSSSRGREKTPKGKRKVTFDAQPEVVTIKREVNAEKEEEDALANQDQRGLFHHIVPALHS